MPAKGKKMMNSYQCMLILASLVSASCATREPEPERAPAPANAVVDFWRAAGPAMWFAKDPDFDRRFRERFLTLHEAAARHELDAWQRTAVGALGLLILLDQFPRNAFRGTPRMYATDAQARAVASAAIASSNDRALDLPMRIFVYLPFGHSEDLADQERSVELARSLTPVDLEHAEHHRDIVKRFGRFPHRNAILKRASRPEELRYLAEGGFAG
jgi:uncharacterized protein (DUF924 family)